MSTQNKMKDEQRSPMVQPGQRALLLSHLEYRTIRKQGQGLESYDLLMRQPEDAEGSDGTSGETTGETSGETRPESERWLPIPAEKYLKHRANGWCEAGSFEDLPERYRDEAEIRDVFSPRTDAPEEGE